MGTPAWQVRESQRQELNTQIMSRIYDCADREEDNQNFLFQVVSCLTACLRRGAKKHGPIWTDGWDADEMTMHFVHGSILQKIRGFARSDAEVCACIARLAKDVLEAATNRFHGDLRSEEIHDPATIFAAGSAMTEVPLEEYRVNDPKT